MHLIGPLIAGVAGAEDGAVELYQRGTMTRATWYADFEGATSNSSGDDIPLDSNGSAVVYVDELVRVVVKDSDDATVRDFVAGDADAAVEVKSSSFTGTAYVGGGMALGNPTTLRAVLNAWITSAGQGDFNVDIDGSSTTLQSALSGGVRGGFFNVKDSAYGAVGDGVTDDRTAVAAAITAAAVAGGIVFFPPGTYRLTDTITVPYNVSLLGCGAAVSVLAPEHATNVGISVTGSASSRRWQRIDGISVLPSSSHAGNLIASTGSADVHLAIVGCVLGNSNLSGNAFDSATSGSAVVLFDGCTVVGLLDTFAAEAEIRGCRLGSRTVATAIRGDKLVVTNCYFDNSSVSSAAPSYPIGTNDHACIVPGAAGAVPVWDIRGCTFSSPSGDSVVAMIFHVIGQYITAGTRISESGNVFESGVWAYQPRQQITPSTQDTRIWLGSRIGKALVIQDDSASLDLDPEGGYMDYEIIIVDRSTNADQSITFDGAGGSYSGVPAGNQNTVVVINSSGGTITSENLVALGAGSGVSISNNDAIFHRVYWLNLESRVQAVSYAPLDIGNPV